MKIIKRGIPPEQKSYAVACSHCGSELEVEHNEARPSRDQRDVGILSVDCPVCSKAIYFDQKQASASFKMNREAFALLNRAIFG